MKRHFAMIGMACAILLLVGAGCTQDSQEEASAEPNTKVAGASISDEGGDISEIPNPGDDNSDSDDENSDNEPDGKGGMVY